MKNQEIIVEATDIQVCERTSKLGKQYFLLNFRVGYNALKAFVSPEKAQNVVPCAYGRIIFYPTIKDNEFTLEYAYHVETDENYKIKPGKVT